LRRGPELVYTLSIIISQYVTLKKGSNRKPKQTKSAFFWGEEKKSSGPNYSTCGHAFIMEGKRQGLILQRLGLSLLFGQFGVFE
jgi:hypothetical protein